MNLPGLLAGVTCAAALLLAAPPQEPGALRAWPRLDAAEAPGAEIAWEQAGAHVGKTVTVRGTVVRSHKSAKVVHLNFRKDWKGTFQVVIFANLWGDFPAPPEAHFLDREILVTGMVKDYQGTPEIVLESAAQIRWADEASPAIVAPKPPRAPPASPRAPGIKVATWNLENFFDGWDDPYREDEQTKPASVTAARRQRIADALLLLDADVVCLQEVENRFALEEFVAAYLPGANYEVVLIEGNDGRGIDVALLSRLPIEETRSYRHRRFADESGNSQRFQRDLLRVRIGAPWNADVFVLHLKSQIGGDQADQVRAAEAREAAAILRSELERNPQWRALVAGDFNDTMDQPPLEAFLKSMSKGGAGFRDACAGTDKISYHQEPHLSRIDFILLSPALAGDLAEAGVVDQMAGVDLLGTSDHYPVIARFLTR